MISVMEGYESFSPELMDGSGRSQEYALLRKSNELSAKKRIPNVAAEINCDA